MLAQNNKQVNTTEMEKKKNCSANNFPQAQQHICYLLLRDEKWLWEKKEAIVYGFHFCVASSFAMPLAVA